MIRFSPWTIPLDDEGVSEHVSGAGGQEAKEAILGGIESA